MSSPFHRSDEPKEISEVNVVPLADVSLVLLIILLVLSPMMTQTMLHVQTAARSKEKPPETAPPPEPDKPPEMVLVVAVGPDALSVGERVFTGAGDFAAFMTAELARRTEKKVFVSPRAETPHGRVVEVLEALKLCGASSVALVQMVDRPQVPEEGGSASTGGPSAAGRARGRVPASGSSRSGF